MEEAETGNRLLPEVEDVILLAALDGGLRVEPLREGLIG